MQEAWHLPLELLIKKRGWLVKREVTLSSRGQVGCRVNNNVACKGPGAIRTIKLGSVPGNLASKSTLSAPPLKPLQRHKEGGREAGKGTKQHDWCWNHQIWTWLGPGCPEGAGAKQVDRRSWTGFVISV